MYNVPHQRFLTTGTTWLVSTLFWSVEAKIEPKESLTLDLHVKIHLQKASVYSLSSTWLGDVTSVWLSHIYTYTENRIMLVFKRSVTKKKPLQSKMKADQEAARVFSSLQVL